MTLHQIQAYTYSLPQKNLKQDRLQKETNPADII